MRTYQSRFAIVAMTLAWFLFPAAGLAQSVPTEETIKRKQLPELTIEEMKREFIGNTLVWKSLKSGAEVPIYYDKNGTRRMNYKGAKKRSRWRFSEQHLCVESFFESNEICAEHYRDGELYRFCDPRAFGLCEWTLTVEDGNSRGL